MYSFYRNFFLLQEAIQKTYSFTRVVLQQFTYRSRAFSLTQPASMQIILKQEPSWDLIGKKEIVYKRKELNSHRISLQPIHCYWSINMTAIVAL